MFFFHFFKILIFWVVREFKGQKMIQNDKTFCPLHSISEEPYIIWPGVTVSKMPHMRLLHAQKIYGVRLKIFWDIITKVAPKVYLQLWWRSHWPGSGVSEECSKSKHLNGGLPILSAPITVFRSKLPKGLSM